jgi:hypothetical protein
MPIAEANEISDGNEEDSEEDEAEEDTTPDSDDQSDGDDVEDGDGDGKLDESQSTVPVNIPVTSDIDINNESQTVRFVEIGTVAVDKETKSHYTAPKNKVTIVDTVTYKGLKAGTQYTMVGTLMNKSNSQPIKGSDGKNVTKSVNFTPTSPDGSMTIEFEVPGSVVEHLSVVAFERCLEGNVLAASHEDINDPDQTVRYSDLASDIIQLGAGLTAGASVIGAVAFATQQVVRHLRNRRMA